MRAAVAPKNRRPAYGHHAEPALPEMSRAFAPRLDRAGIGPMHARQRAAQAVGIGGDQDEMHVVGRQTPGPDLDFGRPAISASRSR
jgi:hypothetical protein